MKKLFGSYFWVKQFLNKIVKVLRFDDLNLMMIIDI
jgi:hypothetical protein